MPKARFIFDYSTMKLHNGETPKPQTIKMYRAALNKLAEEGFTERDDLLKKQDALIKVVERDFDSNYKKRTVLSAVFRVLGDVPNDKRIKLYNYFQKCKDPKPE